MPMGRPPSSPIIRRLTKYLSRGFWPKPRMISRPDARIAARARRYVTAIRDARGGIGGLEDFMHEYSLSTPEGLALMSLAEALLRVPDAATQDRLIEDKLGGARLGARGGARQRELARLRDHLGARADGAHRASRRRRRRAIIRRLAQRLGQPTVRTAARQAMRLLGHQFVLGETIEDALSRGARCAAEGLSPFLRHAGRGGPHRARRRALFRGLCACDRGDRPERRRSVCRRGPGISIKLSALHPRYVARQRERVLAELTPRLIELAAAAKAHDLNLTVDAEEADRLELSLEVFARLLAEPALAGWDGLGLAVQAYQKRAPAVIDWLAEASAASGPPADGAARQGRLLGHRDQAGAGARACPTFPSSRESPRPTSATSPARSACLRRGRASTRSSPRTTR